MSLKKRMFRSNMTILFLSLVSLLAVVFLVLILFEDSIERRFWTMDQAKLDSQISKVAYMVEETGIQDIEKLERDIKEMGYQAAVIKKEEIEAGSTDTRMAELAGALDTEGMLPGQPEIFYYRNATIAAKYIPEEDSCIVAVLFSEENWLKTSLRHAAQTVFWVLFLISAGTVIVLLFLSSYFTKRMNRVVMVPLEELVDGAKRIQSGNLKEEIPHQADAEFENVCQAFNSMQRTILEDQRQRRKTEKARIDMVTGISHDLRTPLTSIQGYIKGVLDGVANTEEKKRLYLRTAYESTEDMNGLLQKLFDFSRLESGQMPFRMVRVDLAEFSAACAAQKEALLDERKVQFFHRKEEEVMPEILLDVEQFRRIFDNLLENSIKYTVSCPVKIWVRVFHTENTVTFEWKDNGPGVPEEKIDRIFERFYRCDESRNQKGSGVGLYVVKYIVERHGGQILAENDSGLKLTLTFPKAEEE